jgi:hypothetical protein
MASELIKTPLAEVRWCKLLGPARDNKFDPTKRPSWTIDLLLDNTDKTHVAWLQEMEDKYAEFHGDARASIYAFPWKAGSGEDDGKTIVKFKLPEFTRKDGTTSEGPTIFDSAKKPWDQKTEIGNGSKMVIGFDIYAWKTSTGCGMTFQPRAAQVVELVEFAGKADPEALFDVVPGGSTGACSLPF